MQKQTKDMSKLVWSIISYGLNHQTFFSFPIADIAKTCLIFLSVACASITTAMAASLNLLTIFMNSYVALWTI